MVRQGEEKTEVSAAFTLEDNINATRWLEDNDLLDGNDCILRRVISKEGRSRAFINGSPVPLSQLKSLGQLLINIHGQHANHQLMKGDHQMAMLDQYAGHGNLLKNTRNDYQIWRQADNHLKRLKENSAANLAQKQLLEYQIKELNELSLDEGEYNSNKNTSDYPTAESWPLFANRPSNLYTKVKKLMRLVFSNQPTTP